MNATQTFTTTTATLALSTSTISFPASVPSGYARQAQLEASMATGFRTYNFFGV